MSEEKINLQYYVSVVRDARFEKQDPEVLLEISDFLLNLDWLVKHDALAINEGASSGFLERIKKD